MSLHNPSRSLRLGEKLESARAALLLLHGRGSSADDIAGVAHYLEVQNVALIAPDATHNTWYPQRFLAPIEQNEPWLSSALSVISTHVAEAEAAGIEPSKIGFIGFSQGACLALEFAARYPRRYGFVAGLSGGLIGPLATERVPVDMQKTPVLVACAEADAHIPLPHVELTAAFFGQSNAALTKLIFRGSAHTIFPEEVSWLREQTAALQLPR